MHLKPEQIEHMKALREKGLSYEQIARMCKVSKTTVRRHTNPAYNRLYKKMNLERYYRDQLDPVKVKKYKAYRKERYDTTGL